MDSATGIPTPVSLDKLLDDPLDSSQLDRVACDIEARMARVDVARDQARRALSRLSDQHHSATIRVVEAGKTAQRALEIAKAEVDKALRPLGSLEAECDRVCSVVGAIGEAQAYVTLSADLGRAKKALNVADQRTLCAPLLDIARVLFAARAGGYANLYSEARSIAMAAGGKGGQATRLAGEGLHSALTALGYPLREDGDPGILLGDAKGDKEVASGAGRLAACLEAIQALCLVGVLGAEEGSGSGPIDLARVAAAAQTPAAEALGSAILTQFDYHFSGDRSTNRVDRPEWCLLWTFRMLDVHIPFLSRAQVTVNQLVSRLCVKGSLKQGSGLVRAVCERVVRRLQAKMVADLQALGSDNPGLFRHTIGELVLFDEKMATLVAVRGPRELGELGVARHLSQNPEMLVRWIAVEKAFANEKIDGIRSSKAPWAPVGRSAPPGASTEQMAVAAQSRVPPATSSGQTLMGVVEELSTRLFGVDTKERAKFALSLEKPLVGLYLDFCVDALEALAGRALQLAKRGQSAQTAWDEAAGCLATLPYVQWKLSSWSESSVYLELSAAQGAPSSGGDMKNGGGGSGGGDHKSGGNDLKNSGNDLKNSGDAKGGADAKSSGGSESKITGARSLRLLGFWDEELDRCLRLTNQGLRKLASSLASLFTEQLGPWSEQGHNDREGASTSAPPSFAAALGSLRTATGWIRARLEPARLWAPFTRRLASFIDSKVVASAVANAGRTSTLGSKRLSAELAAIAGAISAGRKSSNSLVQTSELAAVLGKPKEFFVEARAELGRGGHETLRELGFTCLSAGQVLRVCALKLG